MHTVSIEEALFRYRLGQFPMADGADAPNIHWYTANLRSVLPIHGMHVSRSLKKLLKKAPFEIRADSDFAGVIDGCAAPRKSDPETWISPALKDLMVRLHRAGYAHSVECWQGNSLVGGVYGMALGQVFCGESMFSRVPNASKVALAHLCARLAAGGFQLFDTQYINAHVLQFGAFEIPQIEYEAELSALKDGPSDFHLNGSSFAEPADLLNRWLNQATDSTET